jgi:hypothetical protein
LHVHGICHCRTCQRWARGVNLIPLCDQCLNSSNLVNHFRNMHRPPDLNRGQFLALALIKISLSQIVPPRAGNLLRTWQLYLDQSLLNFSYHYLLLTVNCLFISNTSEGEFVMSIFEKLRNTKKAADEHKPDDSLPKPAPYKHVPTHAASDSLACAPPGWRQVEDRKAIQAQYKRRSEMSRSTSGLSAVTTLHRGVSHHANDWTITTMDQRNTRPPMPALPDSEAIRGVSPLHASGND